jgi:hypothetical protein
MQFVFDLSSGRRSSKQFVFGFSSRRRPFDQFLSDQAFDRRS